MRAGVIQREYVSSPSGTQREKWEEEKVVKGVEWKRNLSMEQRQREMRRKAHTSDIRDAAVAYGSGQRLC